MHSILKICRKIQENSIKKQDLKNLNINNLIVTTSFYNSIRILSCIVKIYCKQIKYLLDDSNEILMLLGNIKKVKKEKSKVTVVEEEDIYISDIIVPSSNLNESIEPMRDDEESTLLKSFNIPVKRKKIEDSVIEYDNKYYKENICRMKMETPFLQSRFEKVFNFNIPSFFNEKLKVTIEEVRDLTILESYDLNNDDNIDFNNDNIDFNNDNIDYNDDNIDFNDDNIDYLKLDDLPSEFIFNDLVNDFTREEKAKSFFALLKHASCNKLEVKQEDSNSRIRCFLN